MYVIIFWYPILTHIIIPISWILMGIQPLFPGDPGMKPSWDWVVVEWNFTLMLWGFYGTLPIKCGYHGQSYEF